MEQVIDGHYFDVVSPLVGQRANPLNEFTVKKVMCKLMPKGQNNCLHKGLLPISGRA